MIYINTKKVNVDINTEGRDLIMAQALIQIVIPFVAMFAIMYFLLILPEKKRTKKYNEHVIRIKS